FVAGWCLKKKQKKSRALVKRLMPQVKSLLETVSYWNSKPEKQNVSN
ncbi:22213_t:CDS:1, partial [Cetraspora pellucida]